MSTGAMQTRNDLPRVRRTVVHMLIDAAQRAQQREAIVSTPNAYRTHEAAVVGRPDEYRGELSVAFVLPRPACTVSEEDLLEYCCRNLVPYKVAAEIRSVDILPKTAVGKVDKVALAATAVGIA